MQKGIILILFSLAGCAHAQHNSNAKVFPVAIDNSFDNLQIEKIQEALAHWTKKTGLNLSVGVVDASSDRVIWKYDELVTFYYAEEGWQKKAFQKRIKRKSTLGITTFPSRDVFIRNVYQMYKVAMHEFGHVLGLDHCHNNWDIMYPLVGSRMSDISVYDIKFVRKHWKDYIGD